MYRITTWAEYHSATAYCDVASHGGGWLVLLRRMNGTVDFDRPRVEYRRGRFGNLLTEFWFGFVNLNRYYHTKHELRVDLEDWTGHTPYAKYSTFIVATATIVSKLC